MLMRKRVIAIGIIPAVIGIFLLLYAYSYHPGIGFLRPRILGSGLLVLAVALFIYGLAGKPRKAKETT